MKIFKLMMVAFVAMLAFTACNNDCDHEFIEVDYSNDIVGIWTCLEPDHSAAYIFNADGTVSTTGVDSEGYWEDVNGNYSVVNNKITMAFDSGHNIEGSFDLIPGQTFSFVDKTGRHTYSYCKEDLSEEIVGMWVCNDGHSTVENDMAIITYSEDGKMTMTAPNSTFIPGDFVNQVSDYKVVGDILFKIFPKENTADKISCLASRIVYTPNGTSLGDILIEHQYTPTENGVMDLTFSFLRVKQNLDLANMSYDYISCYITNAKGEDKDIKFLNTTFNFAKMDGSIIDKFLRSILFSVNFPDANTIEYRCLLEGNYLVSVAPIEVEGNKMTLKMSSRHEAYRDVEIYTFQDADNTQMHMYMPTTSFENFFSNMSLSLLSSSGQVDINNPVHVEAVYKEVADAVESINLSIVCKNTTTRAL